MSVATAFRFAEAFPFCVTDISGGLPSSVGYVDDLTLAEAMEFAWNLEGAEFTYTGSATRTIGPDTTNLNANTVVSFTPFASDVMDEARVSVECMWYPQIDPPTVFSSCPPIKQPNERVCPGLAASTEPGILLDLQIDLSSDTTQAMLLGFWVGLDPINTGKYRVYFYLVCQRNANGPAGVLNMRWQSDSTALPGYTALDSGSITIGSLTFNWWSFYTSVADSATGGSLTATSSSFTYP